MKKKEEEEEEEEEKWITFRTHQSQVREPASNRFRRRDKVKLPCFAVHSYDDPYSIGAIQCPPACVVCTIFQLVMVVIPATQSNLGQLSSV